MLKEDTNMFSLSLSLPHSILHSHLITEPQCLYNGALYLFLTLLGRHSPSLQEVIREVTAVRAIYVVLEVIAAVKGH